MCFLISRNVSYKKKTKYPIDFVDRFSNTIQGKYSKYGPGNIVVMKYDLKAMSPQHVLVHFFR